jgi:hypothetical protein
VAGFTRTVATRVAQLQAVTCKVAAKRPHSGGPQSKTLAGFVKRGDFGVAGRRARLASKACTAAFVGTTACRGRELQKRALALRDRLVWASAHDVGGLSGDWVYRTGSAFERGNRLPIAGLIRVRRASHPKGSDGFVPPCRYDTQSRHTRGVCASSRGTVIW